MYNIVYDRFLTDGFSLFGILCFTEMCWIDCMDWVLILRCIGLRRYGCIGLTVYRCIGLRHYNVLTVLDWVYGNVLDWVLILRCIGLRHYTVLSVFLEVVVWTCVVLLVVLLMTVVSTMCWCMDLYVCNKDEMCWTTDESSSLTQHMSHHKAGGYSKTADTALWVIAREPGPVSVWAPHYNHRPPTTNYRP